MPADPTRLPLCPRLPFPGPREDSSLTGLEHSPALVDPRRWGVHLGSLWEKRGWTTNCCTEGPLVSGSPLGLTALNCRSARRPATARCKEQRLGPADVSSPELQFRRAGSHLPWGSKAFRLKMFTVPMLCRQRGLEATSTLPWYYKPCLL